MLPRDGAAPLERRRRARRALSRGLVLGVLAYGCSLMAPSDADVIDSRGNGGATAGSNGTAASGSGAGRTSGGAAGAAVLPEAGTSAGGTASAGGAEQAGSAGEETAGTSAAAGGDASSDAGAAGADGGAGAPPAEPSTDGLVLWLDAELGVDADDTGGVERWHDRSGAEHHAGQPLPSARPRRLSNGIGGRTAIVFDGATDFLTLPAGFDDFDAGVSFFAVAELTADANCPALLELSDGGTGELGFSRFLERFQYETATDYARSTAAYPIGAPQLLSLIHDTAEVARLFQNGVAAGSHAAMPLPPPVLRTDNRLAESRGVDGTGAACLPFEGALGEMLLYRRALSDGERRAVETYLSHKWSCCAP